MANFAYHKGNMTVMLSRGHTAKADANLGLSRRVQSPAAEKFAWTQCRETALPE